MCQRRDTPAHQPVQAMTAEGSGLFCPACAEKLARMLDQVWIKVGELSTDLSTKPEREVVKTNAPKGSPALIRLDVLALQSGFVEMDRKADGRFTVESIPIPEALASWADNLAVDMGKQWHGTWIFDYYFDVLITRPWAGEFYDEVSTMRRLIARAEGDEPARRAGTCTTRWWRHSLKASRYGLGAQSTELVVCGQVLYMPASGSGYYRIHCNRCGQTYDGRALLRLENEI